MALDPNATYDQLEIARLARLMYEDARRAYSGVPGEHFERRAVQPPAALYVTNDDYLVVNVLTSSATTSLTLGGRVLGVNGEVRDIYESLDGATLNTITTKVFRLGEGFLLGVVVSNLGGGLSDGVCFVSIGLQRGSASIVPYQMLAQDYVTNQFSVVWPAAAVRTAVVRGEIAGTPISVQVSDPAAGAEWSLTVPAATKYTLKTAKVRLTASAAAGNRTSWIVIGDGTHILFQSDVNYVVPSGQVFDFSAGSGLPAILNTQVAVYSLPTDMPLVAGWTIGSKTANLDVADQYSGVNCSFIKWA